MAVRLGPGGKALMILAGLALIGLGLWYAGLLPVDSGAGDSVSDLQERQEARPRASRQAGAEGPETAAEQAEQRPAEQQSASSKGESESSAEEEPTSLDTEPSPGQGASRAAEPAALGSGDPNAHSIQRSLSPEAARPSPPPLLARAPIRLRVSKSVDPGAAPQLMRDLSTGITDVVELGFHEVVELGALARSAVVIGARPPAAELFLCAEESPIESLRAGASVGVSRALHRLPVAHVAEAMGMDPAVLRWQGASVSSAGETEGVLVTEEPSDHLECLSLFEIGAQGPALLLARRRDALVYGKSYAEAAQNLSAAGEDLRRYLISDGPRGYARTSEYAAGLLARLLGAPPAEPPRVATWLLDESSP